MGIGSMKLSVVYPYLEDIAKEYDLKLSIYSHFVLAKKILISRYGTLHN